MFLRFLILILKCSFRIEKEIFPEYKDKEVFLLDVTWEEDYIQKLGEIKDFVIIIVNFPGSQDISLRNGTMESLLWDVSGPDTTL